MRRLCTPLCAPGLLALVVALGLAAPANLDAHAYKVSAEPEPETSLDATPERIEVTFSEAIEPRGSQIQVLHADGTEAALEETAVDPDDPRRLIAALQEELPDGTYTVVWRSVSAVDGHPLEGFFLFAVGEPLEAAAVAPGADDPPRASPVQAAGRWLTHLGLAAVIGALLLHLFAFRSAFGNGTRFPALRNPLSRLRLSVAGAGAGILLVGSFVELVGQAQILGGIPLVEVALQTSWGVSWLWRMALWLVLAVVLAVGVSRERSAATAGREAHASQATAQDGARDSTRGDSAFSASLPLLLAVACAVAIGFTSHVAVGTGVRTPGLVNHLMHMLASSTWIGGVVYVAFAVPVLLRSLSPDDHKTVLPPVFRRFWALALVCIVTLFLSGLYNSWIQVTAPPAIATPYGETLVVKVVLVAALFVVAAVELLWLRPRLLDDAKAPRVLGMAHKGQLALAVVVLLAVGFLANSEPAGSAADRLGLLDPERETIFTAEDEGAEITFTVEPGVVGRNRLILDLEDTAGMPIEADDLAVQLANLPEESIEFEFSGSGVGEGRYVVERVALTVPGAWQAEVVVQRPGAFDSRVGFEFQVVEEPVQRADLLSSGVAWLLLIAQLSIIAAVIGLLRYIGRRGAGA